MRLSILFLSISFLLPLLVWSQIYVSTTGSDNNEGTMARPKGTVAGALRKAREMRRLNDPLTKKGVEIIVGEGTYQFSEPLFIRPEDSGTQESPTIIKALAGAHPVFSGGFTITGWKKLPSTITGLPQSVKGKIWV